MKGQLKVSLGRQGKVTQLKGADSDLEAFRGREILAPMCASTWRLVLLAALSSGARSQQLRLGRRGTTVLADKDEETKAQGVSFLIMAQH